VADPIPLKSQHESRPALRGDAARTSRKAVVAGAIGNMLEWYDFSVYGYLAVVISRVFFPSQGAKLLLTFATFGVGFLMRPVGSIVLGHYGDRLGRRPALIFTVGMMSVSTFLVGIIPPYAVIGIWAPVLLLIFRWPRGSPPGGNGAGRRPSSWSSRGRDGGD
jgi:MHS family proline/betaine transporter-like MFS transporter